MLWQSIDFFYRICYNSLSRRKTLFDKKWKGGSKMERDLEDLKARMKQALENPKKVAEIAVAALRSPYNAYKVVLESTKDKQLAQDWRNTLMLKRDQEKHRIDFLEELTSVFSEPKKEGKMLKVLEERKDLRKRQEEVEKIGKTLFGNAILLLNKKGTLTTKAMWMCFESEDGGSREVPVPSPEYISEINVNGTSVLIRLYARRVNKEQLVAYLEGNTSEDFKSRKDMDLIIDVGNEEAAVYFSCSFKKLSWMSVFSEPAYTVANPGWVALLWTQIEFLKELNAWIERQIGS